MNAILHKL